MSTYFAMAESLAVASSKRAPGFPDVKGIDVVGPLPAEIQEITVFAAGVHVTAKAADRAKAFIEFFFASEAVAILKDKGLQPA